MNVIEGLDPERASARYAHVIRRIARDERIRERTARRRFVEMLKFLDVCAASNAAVSPSACVDGAWHGFILFTREYAEYCEARFGRFIHHTPAEAKDAKAYERAYDEATLRFGTLDRGIWPRPGRTSWLGGSFLGGDGGGCFLGGDGGCGGGGCGGGG